MTVGRNLHMSARTGFQVEEMMGTGTSKGELLLIDRPEHLPSKYLLYAGPLTPALRLCDVHQRGLCHWAVILHSSNCLVTS